MGDLLFRRFEISVFYVFLDANSTSLANDVRFHNYVVEQLAHINEGGRFTKPRDHLPPDDAKKAWAKYDNDLFQTGRL